MNAMRSIVVGLLCLTAGAEPLYRCEMTVDGYSGTSTLTDFPLLVRISPTAIDKFTYGDCAENGADISFTDADGNVLPHEVDTWNPDGESLVWVKISSMARGTKFFFRWADQNHPTNNPTAVWSNYVGVWHFSSLVESTTVKNSACNDYDLMFVTDKTGAISANAPAGTGLFCESGAMRTKDYEPEFSVGSKFTATGWFLLPSYAGTSGKYSGIVSKKVGLDWSANTGWYLQMNQSKTTIGLVESGSTETKYAFLPDVTKNWNHFALICDGTYAKAYFNGSDKPGINRQAVIKASSTEFQVGATSGYFDEYRLRKGAVTVDWAVAEYETVANADYLAAGTTEVVTLDGIIVSSDSMRYGTVSPGYGIVANPADGESYTFTCTDNEEKLDGDGTERAFCTGWNLVSPSNGEVLRRSTDPDEETYSCTHVYRAGEGVMMRWSWQQQHKVTTVAEGGMVSPANPWVADGETVTLTAAESESGKVFVRWEGDVPAESVLTNPLTLTVERAKSVHAVFADLSSVTWRWTGAGADRLASNPENWLNGDGEQSVPTAGAHIVFGADGADKPCKWNLNVPLASWHQEGYASTVTIATRYTASATDAFTNLVIDGDAEVLSGKWTSLTNHYSNNSDSSTYRLRVSVGGNLTVGPDAVIHADKCGYGNGKSPAGTITQFNGGTYGGPGGRLTGGTYDANYVNDKMYGSITEPTHLGSGGNWGIGGGAVYLTVAGHTTLDGILRSTDNNDGHYPGSGGSIYLRTGTLSGVGKINADSHSTQASGSGGRIAVKLTAPGADFSAFDVVRQVSAVCPSTGGNRGASGTIYAEKPGDVPNHGWLVMKGYGAQPPTNMRAMRITYASGQVCDFARITMTNAAVAVFNSGETLVLTNTVLELADRDGVTNGFWFNGGKLTADPSEPYELPCDVVVYGKQPFTDAAMPTVVVPEGRKLTFDGSVSTQTCSIVNCGSVVLKNQSSISLTSDWTNEGTATIADSCRVAFVGAEVSTIAGDTTFPNLICQEPGKTLAIAAGSTLTVPYSLALAGCEDCFVTLKRASGDANWNLNVGADAFVQLQYLEVDHSTATGVPLTAYLSDDAGGNVNWTFDDSGLKNVWTGITSSDFADPANWSNGEVPGPGDALEVMVDSPMVVKTDICFGSVLIGGKANVTFQNKVDVTGDLVVTNTATLTYSKPGSVGGNVFVGSGAKMTHKANSTAETYRLELDVGGDFTVEDGGAVDVSEKGYSGNNKGPGAPNGNRGSSYGGLGSSNDSTAAPNCYGSVLCPTNCGSSGNWGGIGGGVAILHIAGNLTLDGSILAKGGKSSTGSNYDGTGGSIWVTAAGISGAATGCIRARCGNSMESSGGRIAVHLTGKGNDFSSYLGAIDACSPNRGGCGTVYLQTGDEEFGKGKVVIANSGTQTQQTQLPSPRICDPKELSRRVRVEVATGGVLGLTKDLNVDDLTMDGNSKLYLNGHTLFIYHRRHALGTKASQIVPGGTAENPGRIIWLQGLMLMVK